MLWQRRRREIAARNRFVAILIQTPTTSVMHCTLHFNTDITTHTPQAALDALHEYYARTQAAAAAHNDQIVVLRLRVEELETSAASANQARYVTGGTCSCD